jgi:hypothetical protein
MSQTHYTPVAPPYYSMRQTARRGSFADKLMSPEIIMDVEERRFLIKGSSNPRNPKEFYSDVFLWLEIYSLCPLEGQLLEIDLQDFNSASALYMLKLFEMWLSINRENVIVWYHSADDAEMIESGMEYKEMVGGRFYLKRKEDQTRTAPLKLAS